ncbi:hypothetical protein COCON_G00096550 [Conger conger]|uniref:Uncharacterized protein n=1 Tax=Conger conger TaxID=82655 RepID=A0A9Q1I1E8_CONCO|nr:hypothetical protein COCON_G00096550 [Conger conger]
MCFVTNHWRCDLNLESVTFWNHWEDNHWKDVIQICEVSFQNHWGDVIQIRSVVTFQHSIKRCDVESGNASGPKVVDMYCSCRFCRSVVFI